MERQSRDERRLPRFTVGSRHEPNRLLVVTAHDPVFNNPRSVRVTYAGRKVLGTAWMQSRGPWLAVLHRNMTASSHEQPCYDILRLVPVPSHQGEKPLQTLHEAARREANAIADEWNRKADQQAQGRNFFVGEWSRRSSP